MKYILFIMGLLICINSYGINRGRIVMTRENYNDNIREISNPVRLNSGYYIGDSTNLIDFEPSPISTNLFSYWNLDINGDIIPSKTLMKINTWTTDENGDITPL